MNDIILLNRYKLLWKERNEKVIVAEIRHYLQNEYGGTLETPIGMLVCYKENNPLFWNIKINLRSDIRYSQTQKHVWVMNESAFKFKWRFFIERLNDIIKPRFQPVKALDEAIKQHLITNNWISEPFAVSRSIEKTEDFHFFGDISTMN
ncbi:MAG: hypothetical protein EP332_03470 [Bacteroidetes bacterium]|nr:MAG: hypothetical protein EP332_03470 [Bacteroidota bacterium]